MADSQDTPPATGSDTEQLKKPAPTFYAIIAAKLLKGLLFAWVAMVLYTRSDRDLPEEYQNFLHHLRVNPERRFWVDLAKQVGQLTEKKVILAAEGTFVYSLFSLVEGIGLLFRIRWVGWLTIGESAFFIPIEIYELVQQQHRQEPGRSSHPLLVLLILAFNVLVVWYLFQNRQRLFRHHHHMA